MGPTVFLPSYRERMGFRAFVRLVFRSARRWEKIRRRHDGLICWIVPLSRPGDLGARSESCRMRGKGGCLWQFYNIDSETTSIVFGSLR